jgi:hypothetical protein
MRRHNIKYILKEEVKEINEKKNYIPFENPELYLPQ